MDNDLIERLRAVVRQAHPDWSSAPVIREAIDALEAARSDACVALRLREGLIAKWRSEAAQLESVGDDNALAKAYAQRLDADELEGALGQQSGAVAPTTAECPHDWEQDEAHEDWARCYKCGISRRKPLAQQPAAVDGEVKFNAAFFVSRTGNQIEQLTDYDDYCRASALLGLMDLGQKRASARGLAKKGGGKVATAWVTAPQIVNCDCAAQPGGSDNDR